MAHLPFLDLPATLQAVLGQYRLKPDGIHGLTHWGRVQENGERLAGATGGNLVVVRLFALLHDAVRWNDGRDADHGARGAALARSLHGRTFQLPDEDLARLLEACQDHTHVRHHPDPTIQACWDADRLDLGRVGTIPDPEFMGPEAGRREVRTWAHARAVVDEIPHTAWQSWGLEPGRRRARR